MSLPSFSDIHQDLVTEVAGLFDRAEGLLKSLESVRLDGQYIGLFMPTVNELRYAGRHLSDCLLCTDARKITENLQKAKSHCQRAIYDACDAHLQALMFEFTMFREDFRKVVISDIMPEYLQILTAYEAAKTFLEQGRGAGASREALYEESLRHREALERLCKNLPAAREDLNKRVRSFNKQATEQQIALVIGAAGLIVAALAVLLG
jgi:hypothetical protein